MGNGGRWTTRPWTFQAATAHVTTLVTTHVRDLCTDTRTHALYILHARAHTSHASETSNTSHENLHKSTHTCPPALPPARMHARTKAQMHTRTCARMHAQTHARMHARTHACTHARTHACADKLLRCSTETRLHLRTLMCTGGVRACTNTAAYEVERITQLAGRGEEVGSCVLRVCMPSYIHDTYRGTHRGRICSAAHCMPCAAPHSHAHTYTHAQVLPHTLPHFRTHAHTQEDTHARTHTRT